MNSTAADRVWNRAALESGGDAPGPGDRALSDLMLAHGLVMNGGVHHALQSLEPAELAAAVDGYSYFGIGNVATFFSGASDDPVLMEWTEETEPIADGRYAEMVPDDGFLMGRFKAVFRERPSDFAPT